MDILEINKQTLYNLYEQFPESFSELRLVGNNLMYRGEAIDISNFDINTLLTPGSNFAASLSVLSSEDIFKIIRLHAMKLESLTQQSGVKSNTEQKVETIKSENPLMKNISIVTRSRNGLTEEYLNIVDSTGRDHLFKNDRNIDIFAIYEKMKYENIGHDITPDELAAELNRKLYQIQLKGVRDIEDSSTVSEEFDNKMEIVNKPYKDSKRFSVYGNEDNDIAVVADNFGGEHKVVTFDHNQFGDLVMQNHGQNVAGNDTSLVTDGSNQSTTFESEVSANTDVQVTEEMNDEVVARLIDPQEFYRLINSSEELTPEQQRNVDLYYAYIGDLIIYEDYLLSDLRQMLNEFRAFVYDLEFGEHEEINDKQQGAVNKNYELEEKKAHITPETMEQIKKDVKKLELIKENSSYNSGSISTIQVIALIVGISIILTAVTLYLIN